MSIFIFITNIYSSLLPTLKTILHFFDFLFCLFLAYTWKSSYSWPYAHSQGAQGIICGIGEKNLVAECKASGLPSVLPFLPNLPLLLGVLDML